MIKQGIILIGDEKMNNNNYTKNTYYESESSSVIDNVSINKMMAGSFLWMFIGALVTMLVGIGCTMFLKEMIVNMDAGGIKMLM